MPVSLANKLIFGNWIWIHTTIKWSDWQTDRLTDWQTDRLTDWQTDRLTDWQTDRLTDWQEFSCIYWILVFCLLYLGGSSIGLLLIVQKICSDGWVGVHWEKHNYFPEHPVPSHSTLCFSKTPNKYLTVSPDSRQARLELRLSWEMVCCCCSRRLL